MGSNNKMKKLFYFLLGFGFALWSFYFFWKIMVFFGLEYWSENCLDPDMTGERNSACKLNLESDKIHQHSVHNFTSSKHSEADVKYVPDLMSWKHLCSTKKLLFFFPPQDFCS